MKKSPYPNVKKLLNFKLQRINLIDNTFFFFFFLSEQMGSENGQANRIGHLITCPWKKSLCMLATKSYVSWRQCFTDCPQGILDQQLRPHPIHALNIFIMKIIILKYVLYNYFKTEAHSFKK